MVACPATGLQRSHFFIEDIHLSGKAQQRCAGTQVAGGGMFSARDAIEFQSTIPVPAIFFFNTQCYTVNGFPLKTLLARLIVSQISFLRVGSSNLYHYSDSDKERIVEKLDPRGRRQTLRNPCG